MQITINIPDLLAAKAQAAACREQIPFDELVGDALRNRLEERPAKPWMAVLDEMPAVPEETTAEILRRVAEADAEDLRQTW